MRPLLRRPLGALALALTLTACSPDPGPAPIEPVTADPPAAEEQEQAPDSEPVTLAFVGDIHFEGHLRKNLAQPARVFGPIAQAMGEADFTMGNLEAALTAGGRPDPKALEDPARRFHFRTDFRALTALEAAGVDGITVANNHGVDFGPAGLRDTLRMKRNSPIPILGVGANRPAAFTPHRTELKGTSFSFFAADASPLESTVPTWQAGKTHAGLAAARGPGKQALLNAVRREAEAGAVTVIYLHWGEEGASCPTGGQQALASELALAGADIIVGSHAHTPQGSGWLGPHTYVNYGLGNFYWYHGAVAETGILRLRVQDGQVMQEEWRAATLPRYGGAPVLVKKNSQLAAFRQWDRLKACTNLDSSRPEPRVGFGFTAEAQPIGPALAQRMASSYRRDCPVPLSRLRYLTVAYVGFDGRHHKGELIVAREQVQPVIRIFRKLYQARFPIQSMRLVSDYGGSDDLSMAANNTSGFNCRRVLGTDRWSNHSYGAAIDINPLQNPYVVGGESLPPGSDRFANMDRSAGAEAPKGAIVAADVVVRAFAAEGWAWGGSFQDYQHFAAGGG